jgi:hypothetical protein
MQYLYMYMKSKHSKSWVFLSLFAALALISAGCGTPSPAAWNLNVTKLTPASIDVDIVGVQPSDESQLMNMKPDDWWAAPPNDLVRRGYKDMTLTTNFASGDKWLVAKDDPIWKKWFGAGVDEIMVIANLPRVHDNTPNDPRRKFLKLTKGTWKDAVKQTLEIHVQDDRVRVVTAMQAGK